MTELRPPEACTNRAARRDDFTKAPKSGPLTESPICHQTASRTSVDRDRVQLKAADIGRPLGKRHRALERRTDPMASIIAVVDPNHHYQSVAVSGHEPPSL